MKRTALFLFIAVFLVAACGPSHEERLAQLEQLEQWNRADSVMRYDSLAERLVDYFDSKGSANERMRAHYILGRTYADMGEAPRAIDAYHDAVNHADTAASDCDYRTLGCVFSQMAAVFHRQLLLSNELEARRQSFKYAMMSGDTLGFLNEMKLTASIYILQNKCDSAEIVLKESLGLYEEYGFVQEMLRSSTMLMALYVNQQEHLQDLKRLIDRFEAESNLFDSNHELHSKRRIYYYYKGRYYLETNNLDSAETNFRKVYHPNMAFVAQNSMYKGLLGVFQKRHQSDSIAKYAQLYCQVNDSSIVLKDQELTARMANSYQYNRIQKLAFENELNAKKAKLQLIMIFCITTILAIIGIVTFVNVKKRQNRIFTRLKSEFIEANVKYNEHLHSLRVLENSHKQLISIIQDELYQAKGETSKYEEKYKLSLATIDHLNSQYQEEKVELLTEIERLQTVINTLKQSKDLSSYVETSKLFFESDIVKYIRNSVEKSRFAMSDEIWGELTASAIKCFPTLINDLNKQEGMTQQKQRVCLLSLLQLRTSDIANLLDVIPQHITNLKRGLNIVLFGVNSARTLSMNLMQKYNIIG